ncbi:hypothetical protein E8E12_002419 [Didymella heteroderae]|uniref:Uncharacterized protein n=1 Tax=Didymella heteroderae TaxID=1769908 RepID=A0A9P4WZ84_9PLEO|nr:hypothetical protein E8E12_002419 [Didymella heteroderae]
MKFIMPTTLLAAAALAAPDLKTTAKDTAAACPPICKFDPAKGEYICPEGVRMPIDKPADSKRLVDTERRETIPLVQVNTASEGGAATINAPVTDCGKCQADWEKCLSVASNDPQCKECPAGQC